MRMVEVGLFLVIFYLYVECCNWEVMLMFDYVYGDWLKIQGLISLIEMWLMFGVCYMVFLVRVVVVWLMFWCKCGVFD